MRRTPHEADSRLQLDGRFYLVEASRPERLPNRKNQPLKEQEADKNCRTKVVQVTGGMLVSRGKAQTKFL